MREFKFRAYDKLDGMKYFDFSDIAAGRVTVDHGVYDVPVMQYSGLKDKNGKEVYEGDIAVSFKKQYENFPTTNKVQFIRGCWRLKAGSMNDVPLYNYDESELEVIGNIYENPELLEDTHE